MDSNSFNLQKQTDRWISKIKSDPSFTESDHEELKNHFLDLIDKLKEKGLDDEEAFLVALNRIGNTDDWDSEYQYSNWEVMQVRRSLVILGGVLLYFFLYFFIRSTSKLLMLLLIEFQTDKHVSVIWVGRYLIAAYISVLIFFIIYYFFNKKIISFIEKVEIKPKQTIIFLGIIVFLGIADDYIWNLLRSMMADTPVLISRLHHYYIYFQYTFPLMFGIIFVIVYFRYYKKAGYS